MTYYNLLLPPPTISETTYWATVTDDSPLRVQLDGDSGALPITPDTLVAGLAVNDRVLVALRTSSNPGIQGRRVVVIGRSGGIDLSGYATTASLSAYATTTVTDALDTRLDTLEAPVLFEGVSSAAQSIGNATDVAILLGAENIDTHNAHSTSSNTSRFTAPVAGYYLFGGAITYAFNTSGTRIATWRKNGSTLYGGTTVPANSYTGTRVPLPAQLLQLAANDYVEMVAHQNSGGSLNTEWTTGTPTTFCRMTAVLVKR